MCIEPRSPPPAWCRWRGAPPGPGSGTPGTSDTAHPGPPAIPLAGQCRPIGKQEVPARFSTNQKPGTQSQDLITHHSWAEIVFLFARGSWESCNEISYSGTFRLWYIFASVCSTCDVQIVTQFCWRKYLGYWRIKHAISLADWSILRYKKNIHKETILTEIKLKWVA